MAKPQMEQHRKGLFDKCIGDVKNALLAVCENQGMAFKGKYSIEVVAVSIFGIYERVAYQYLFWQEGAFDIKLIGKDAVAFLIGGVNNLLDEA